MASAFRVPPLALLGGLVLFTPSVARPALAQPALAQPGVVPGMGPASAAPASQAGRYGGGFIEFLMTGGAPAAATQPLPAPAPMPPRAVAYRASTPSASEMRDPDYGYAPEMLPPEPAPAPSSDAPAPAAYAAAPRVITYAPAQGAAVPVRPVPGYAAPRKAVNPLYLRQEVPFAGRQAPGTVVIDTTNKFLYLVEGEGRALRYGIGVGREGFVWTGEKTVTRKAEWPGWTPPAEMIKRRPDLPSHMEGGLANPLGARAMYLGDTLYRIHGTNEPDTIGTNVSSGCIRLTNDDVADLYERVKVGTHVVVM